MKIPFKVIMIKVSKTNLKNVLIVKPSMFEDFRGQFLETYNEELYQKKGIDVKFIQDDISLSKKNVLRGIHGDNITWKLVSCLFGKIYLAVIDCDKNSKDFGKWQSFTLSDKNRFQVLIPPKYGNAHLILSKEAVFSYKQSAYYDREKQFSYKWNDPRFKVSWPIKNPILSKRDK